MADGIHLSRAAIQNSQLEQLRSLVAELFPGNAFYTHKLSAAGITFDVASLEDFSNRFPFTTKQELVENQRAHPPFGTALTYPLERYTRFHQTSGTSGIPLRWLDTQESWESLLDNWTEVYHAAKVSKYDRIYFAFSFGPFLGFWTAFEAGTRLGALCIPGGGLSSSARLRAMIDNGATVLCCTPTYAMRLAEVAAEEKIDLSQTQIKSILVAGEPGGSIPATRAHLAKLWPKARIFDHHGMTETGPVTYECPDRPCVLHVIESSYYAEIINPVTSKPAKPGETGELVLTTLARIGSPLLRYRTGDIVKRPLATSTCSCGGNELTLEGGILGRTDDMVVIRGVNVYPGAVEEIMRNNKDVAEYRVHISNAQALPEMSLQIEPQAGCKDIATLIASLEKTFETNLALRIPVTSVPIGTLPRFEMKAKRWIRV